MDGDLIVPTYEEWIDASNLATKRLFEASQAQDEQNVKLYAALALASSLCAIAAAIKERS